MRKIINDKNQKFMNQIRKNQRQNIRAFYRSKLLKEYEIQQQENQSNMIYSDTMTHQSYQKLLFLRNLFPNSQSNDSYEKKVIKLLVSVQKSFESDQTNKQKDNIIKRIIKLKNNQAVSLNLEKLVEMIPIQSFLECLKILPRTVTKICTYIKASIIKNNRLDESLNMDTKLYYQHLTKINSCLIQLKSILVFCQTVLNQYYSIKQDFQANEYNAQMIYEITNILIEISCFKFIQVRQIYEIVEELNYICTINKNIYQIRWILNDSIISLIIPLVHFFKFEQSSAVKLFINFIHISGNIFISLNEDKIDYQEQSQKILDQTNHILTTLNQIIPNQPNSIQQTINSLHDTALWLIRNQILIIEGMFKGGQSSDIVSLNTTFLSSWITILTNIFINVQAVFQLTNRLNTKIAEDTLLIAQLIINDFKIDNAQMFLLFANARSYLHLCNSKNTSHFPILKVISKLYQTLLNNKLCDKIFNQIVFEYVEQICLGNVAVEQELQLCSKIVNPNIFFKQQMKNKAYTICCKSFEEIYSNILILSSVKVYSAFIKLIKNLYLYGTVNNMHNQLQIIDHKRLLKIMQICNNIWVEAKDVESIIETLQFLYLIGQDQHLSAPLKIIILDEGYFEQLEQLSGHINQTINKLIYQIYQILEIQ